jgi:hypothetical protein
MQKLDPRSVLCTKRGYPHMRPGDPGETFLLDAPVFARSGDLQTETVAIECEADLGTFCGDRGMVDAK